MSNKNIEMTEKAKELKREYYKKYRDKNKAAIKEYHKSWRDRNPDKVKQADIRYWERKANE